MAEREIVYIRTEPIPSKAPCKDAKGPSYRCTIELVDGSTITRCGMTERHALANAIACYKTIPKGGCSNR